LKVRSLLYPGFQDPFFGMVVAQIAKANGCSSLWTSLDSVDKLQAELQL
jgi:hypothetical protein